MLRRPLQDDVPEFTLLFKVREPCRLCARLSCPSMFEGQQMTLYELREGARVSQRRLSITY